MKSVGAQESLILARPPKGSLTASVARRDSSCRGYAVTPSAVFLPTAPLTHLSRSQAAPRTTAVTLTAANNLEFIIYSSWSWFVSGREKTQRSRSAKYPLARHCSFDSGRAPRRLFAQT